MSWTNPKAAPAGIARVELVRLRPPRNPRLQLSIQSGSKFVGGGWTSLRTRSRNTHAPTDLHFLEVDSSKPWENSDGCDHPLLVVFPLLFLMYFIYLMFISTVFVSVNFFQIGISNDSWQKRENFGRYEGFIGFTWIIICQLIIILESRQSWRYRHKFYFKIILNYRC